MQFFFLPSMEEAWYVEPSTKRTLFLDLNPVLKEEILGLGGRVCWGEDRATGLDDAGVGSARV